MKMRTHIVLILLALLALAGCAKTQISDRQEYTGGKLPRPEHILVYDFAATAADLSDDSALAGRISEHDTPQTAEQIEMGRKVGAEIAAHLVAEIRAMGMPAERASDASQAQINDLVIRGYLLSVKKGDALERVAIGLGSGASELRATAEGFQMTATGLRKLGGGELDAGGGKTPGAAVGAAVLIATHNPLGLIVSTGVKAYGEESGKSTIEGRADQTAKEIADQLKKKFEEQGWI
ncbi:MAG: DUF4410 domain-containing protein [Desulfobacterales bacterium]